MAQTQQRKSSGRSGSSSRSTAKGSKASGTRSQNKRSASAGSQNKRSASAGSQRSTSARSRSNGQNKLDAVTEGVASGAKGAAAAVDNVGSKAKTGLLAGGAAAVGLAATAIATRQSRNKTKVLGVALPKRKGKGSLMRALPFSGGKRMDLRRGTQQAATRVSGAADSAEQLGRRLSDVARSVRLVSDTAKEAAKK